MKDVVHFKVKNFIMLFAAGVINAVGVTLLLLPADFYDSGLSGVSMLIIQLLPQGVQRYVQLWIPLIILNAPVFVFAMKRQGIEFTLYSLFVIMVYSLSSLVFQRVVPLYFPDFFENGSPIGGGEKIICAIFGGALSGVGSGMAIRFGGTMDGAESFAVMFAKRLNLSVGNFVLIFNVFLYLVIGVLAFTNVIPNSGARDFTPALYSIVAYFVASKAVDFISDGLDQAKGAFIITDKNEEVSRALSEEFGRGLTLIDGRGYYSKIEKEIIYCVINRFQVAKLRDIVSKVDPMAFVTLMDITDVIGTSVKYSRVNEAFLKQRRLQQRQEREKREESERLLKEEKNGEGKNDSGEEI